MNDREVADAVQIKYMFIGYCDANLDDLILLRRDHYEEFQKLITYINR